MALLVTPISPALFVDFRLLGNMTLVANGMRGHGSDQLAQKVSFGGAGQAIQHGFVVCKEAAIHACAHARARARVRACVSESVSQ